MVGSATEAVGGAVAGAASTAVSAAGDAAQTAVGAATTAVEQQLPMDPARMYFDPSTLKHGASQVVGGLPEIGDPVSMMKKGAAGASKLASYVPGADKVA